MAVRVTAVVYGTVAGAPPYQGSNSTDAFSNLSAWESPAAMSFPAGTGVLFHPVTPGQRVGTSSNYIYSVIEVQATGSSPQPQSIKYGSGKSVATLASDAA